jgi:tetratricopeptide (TPR) repeat protein
MFGLTRYLLRKADAARDAKAWPVAESAYRAVLERNPGLARIWVQLGHSLKEQGSIAEALAAYEKANLVLPDQADTIHQIGRMLHVLGDDDAALASYERALALDPSLGNAVQEARLLRRRLQARRNPRLTGLPERLRYVMLGTTGTCNASCVHCPTGKIETAHVPRIPMPMALFHKIVDGIADLELPITDQVSFGLFGDGLVDPMVVQRAAYLNARLPDARISVNTNGAAFNAKKHAALNDHVFTVALHCESLVPETYNDLMRPLRAERVFPKFEEILATFPGKVLVSVPVSKRNLEELPTIQEWFLSRGAKVVAFDPLSSRCAEDRSVFDSLALDPHPIRCPPEIMDDLIIDCDGQVLVCCQDFERVEGIGNLQTESLAEVLVGIHRTNMRKLLAEGRHEEMATCSRCYADLRE